LAVVVLLKQAGGYHVGKKLLSRCSAALVVLFGLFGSAAIVGTGVAGASTPSTWTIGAVGTYGGPFASSLGQAKNALEAWVSATNAAGGIDGHKVKAIIMDDGADPGTSSADVHQLIEQDHVIAIVGEYSVLDSVWASYAEAQGVPVIGAVQFNTTFGSNPDFFPAGTTTGPYNYGQVSLAEKLGTKKTGLVSVTTTGASNATVNFYKYWVPKLGMTLAYNGTISQTGTNFTANCVAAQQAGVQSWYVGATEANDLTINANCAQQGFKPINITNGYSVSPNWLGTPGSNGTYIIDSVSPMTNNAPGDKAFVKAMKKYQPGVSYGMGAKLVWSSGQLFAAAANAAHLGNSPTPAEVTAGLYDLHGVTLGGIAPPLTFTKGQGHNIDCWFTGRIQNNKFTAPNGQKLTCESPANVAKDTAAGL
jgi:branched-chain amino acid transport system substrate-binding protein